MKKVNDIISNRLNNIKDRIAQKMVELNRNASGRTVGSLQVQLNEGGGTLYGSSAFLSLERGRGPGGVPHNINDILVDWIKAKGIAVSPKPNQDKETAYKSFAGAIAYNIMTKGTTLYRKGGYDDIYTSAVEEEVDALGNEIASDISLEVSSIVENSNKRGDV